MSIVVRNLVFASAVLATATAYLFASSAPASQGAPAPLAVRDVRLVEFRSKLDDAIDRIREDLESRLASLDASNPDDVEVVQAGETMLKAWNDLDRMLPYMSEQGLESTRFALSEAASCLKGVALRIQARRDAGMQRYTAAGSCGVGYEGGSFAGAVGDLVQDLINALLAVFDVSGDEVPGIVTLQDFISYPEGLEGERSCKEAQEVLEYLADLMPDLSLSFGIVVADIGFSVPAPVKIIFLTLALSNAQECVKAEFQNGLKNDCESNQLAAAVMGIQAQLEDVRMLGCEEIRLLNTPQGMRSSDIAPCEGQIGWPYSWPRGSNSR